MGASGASGQNFGGLGFNGGDHSLGFSRHEIERRNELFASQSLDPLQNYLDGRLNLALQMRTGPKSHVFDLIFRRIPKAVADLSVASDGAAGDGNATHVMRRAYWDNEAMRVGIPYLVQSPEGVIPSLVWQEASQERVDFRWIAGKTVASDFPGNSGCILGEGKTSIGRRSSLQGDGATIDGVVKCIPDISSSILDDIGQLGGERRPLDSDAKNALAGLVVVITRVGVTLRADKLGDNLLGSFNLIPCMAN